jgi:DNA polymerase-3 subunit beta
MPAMKCICDRAALQEALAAASGVTLARTPKPILQCVRVAAERDVLTLTAYDQEVGLRYRVRQVEVTRPGETLVPCDRLFGVVRESSDETMSLEVEQGVLHVRGQDSHFRLNGQSASEFPPVPDMEGEPDLVVQVGALVVGLERTLFAAAKEGTRYAINGVLWEKSGKQLRLVATDGRRLAMSTVSLEKSVGEDQQPIVPTKVLQLLSRLSLPAEEALEVQLGANQVVMRSPTVTLSSVLVEGRFPRYEDVLPKDQDRVATLKTEELLSGVKRARVLLSTETNGIRMDLSSEGMRLSGYAPEHGDAEVRVPMDYQGAEMKIGFNPEFLIEALKVCEETSTIELKDSSKPGLLRSGSQFQYVVMPVNLATLEHRGVTEGAD